MKRLLNSAHISGVVTVAVFVSLLGSAAGMPASAQTIASISITPPLLPTAVMGLPYSQTLAVSTTQAGPFYWSLSSGTLPAGLTLNTAGGSVNNPGNEISGQSVALSGTPTQSGSFTFTISVTNRSVAELQTYAVTVAPNLNSNLTIPSAISTSTLQAQLADLAAQLQQLQFALANRSATPGLPNTGVSAPTFTRTLSLGSRGSDVLALQEYLNQNGFSVAAFGPGSPGNETDFFGTRTRLALVQWQRSHGISPADGVLGPSSRALIQSGSLGSSMNNAGSSNGATNSSLTMNTTKTTATTTTPMPTVTVTAAAQPAPSPNIQSTPNTPATPNAGANSPNSNPNYYPPSPSAATASPNY